MHIGTFKFHGGQIIGDYERNVVKENKTTKKKVKIVCADANSKNIDYNISKGILMINLKYSFLTGMASCITLTLAFCKYIGHATLLMDVP